MPIYEYQFEECKHVFEKFYHTSESGEVNCPSCQSVKDRKDYERAAKAAEKAGKSEWEIKDLYRKTGKKT